MELDEASRYSRSHKAGTSFRSACTFGNADATTRLCRRCASCGFGDRCRVVAGMAFVCVGAPFRHLEVDDAFVILGAARVEHSDRNDSEPGTAIPRIDAQAARQIASSGLEDRVEIVHFLDDCKLTIGRQGETRSWIRPVAEFTAFVDDDE